LRVGIHWRSGASEERILQRPLKPADARRTPSRALELTEQLAADHTNAQIAEQLNNAGIRTGTGGQFTHKTVQWLRWRHKIPYRPTWAHDGELTVNQLAEQLSVSAGTVYDWIKTDKLTAHRGPDKRLYIPHGPNVTQQCRERVANSVHLPIETKIRAAGGAV